MHRHAFDRWADTTPFRLALLLAAVVVVPVLLLGAQTTVIGAAVFIAGRPRAFEPQQIAFALVSLGGVLGFVGYLRAHWGGKDPREHNLTLTLAFLAAGVLAALSVAGFALTIAAEGWRGARGATVWLVLGTLFATANLLWTFAGIASMQRLLRRYAETTGRAFDGLPVWLLLVAIALATAAALKTATL